MSENSDPKLDEVQPVNVVVKREISAKDISLKHRESSTIPVGTKGKAFYGFTHEYARVRLAAIELEDGRFVFDVPEYLLEWPDGIPEGFFDRVDIW